MDMAADEEASAQLLPPSYESQDKKKATWNLRNMALLAALILNLAFIAVFWLTNKPAAAPPPQWNDALQAAELAASKWCSGNGNVFVDSVGGECECNFCFTGPDCSESVPDCIADADSGDPLLFEAYWRQNADLGTTVIPGWYRMSYIPRDGAATFFMDAFMAAIRDLHALVGNAVTEGRYIVAGTGSMQLINAVVHSLALQDEGRVSPVVAKAPFYNAYAMQTEYLESPLYKFAGEPARLSGKPNEQGGGGEIELIASPNNPSFQMQEVAQNVTGPVVYDHAYYWPHLAPITKPMDYDIMLFTLSKITGHAGSRVGWVILKDFDLYQKVTWYVTLNTLGVSHEAQARATQLMRAVVQSYSTGDKKGIFHFGYDVLQSRWARLQVIFRNSSRFSLQELQPGYCNFFKKVSQPSPGYAWIHCNYEEDADCQAVMLSAGITGRPGSEFGSSDRFVRLALLKRQSSFENLATHLEKLVADT